MNLDFSKPLLDLRGAEVVTGPNKTTFRSVCEQILLADGPGPFQETKLARFRLALKISSTADPVEISVDEAKLLQDQVKEFGTTLVVGRFDELLSGKQVPSG